MIVIIVGLFSKPLQAQGLHEYKMDSTSPLIRYGFICKSQIPVKQHRLQYLFDKQVAMQAKPVKISGNILYDVNYRSLLDTPFAAKDFVQHFLQTNFSVLLFDKYPTQVILSSRQSNSPYFKNYVDVSFRFNHQEYNRSIKEQWERSIERKFQEQTSLANIAYASWQKEEVILRNLERQVQSGAYIQKLIEAKEFLAREAKGLSTEIKPPAVNSNVAKNTIKEKASKFESSEQAKSFIEEYGEKKRAVDSLEKEAAILKATFIKYKQQGAKKLDSLKSALRSAKSLSELKKLQPSLYDNLSAKEKLLLGIQNFSVGRSPVNYSELSAKNISITGVNVEYSGRYYWALALGGVDYRFRDFVQRDTRYPSQYLGLVRFGKGITNGEHVILTAYRGRKNNFSFSTPSSQQNVYGFTVQSHYQLSQSQSITLEAAKSSTLSPAAPGGLRKTSFELSDHTTTAYAVKYSSTFPKTNTKLWGTYRYLGGNFQSFSLISNNSNQHSWNINVDQSLFKKMLTVRSSIRKNEWHNPYVGDYNSQAIFKSFFLSFRKYKLPSISLSYMPASQLANIGGSLYETFFQVFTATASHFYRLNRLRCQTIVSLSYYEQSSKDSGFLYAGSNNLMVSHLFLGKNWTATTTIYKNITDGYNLSVFDQGLQVYSNKGFSLGAGIKINRLDKFGHKTGYYTNCVLPIKYIGDISFSYESSFLPGIGKQLVTSDIGRVTYYKRF